MNLLTNANFSMRSQPKPLPKPTRKLSYRAIQFCYHQAYPFCKTATEAAIKAGYSPRSARSQASRLMSDPQVRLCIEALRRRWMYKEKPVRAEPKRLRKKLNYRQFAFTCICQGLISGERLTGKDAAILAGYSPKTAAQQASRLMRNPEIAHRVGHLHGDRQTFRELQVSILSRKY